VEPLPERDRAWEGDRQRWLAPSATVLQAVRGDVKRRGAAPVPQISSHKITCASPRPPVPVPRRPDRLTQNYSTSATFHLASAPIILAILYLAVGQLATVNTQ